MSRAGLRDDMRSLDQETGAGRSLLGQALKRDAQRFINSTEYEFRKVVGVPRTMAKPAKAEQHLPLESATRQAQKAREGSDES